MTKELDPQTEQTGSESIPRPTLRGNMCQCTACGRTFSSVTLFDGHRVGPFDGTRVCLSDPELIAKGWTASRELIWKGPPMSDEAKARFVKQAQVDRGQT